MLKGNSWRPEGWMSPRITVTTTNARVISRHHTLAFEAGADAMLDALRKEGQCMPKGAVLKSFFDVPILENGTLVFIPDNEDE